MKNLLFIIITFLAFGNVQQGYTQITIGKIDQIEQEIVDRPKTYDSLKNIEWHKALKDYKQYIGLQVYLPPISNMQIGYPATDKDLFLFSAKINTVKTGVESKVGYWGTEANKSKEVRKQHVYDSLMTYVYKPFQYSFYQSDRNILPRPGVCSDSSKISDTYYTILDVLYGDNLQNIIRVMRKKMDGLVRELENTNKFVHYLSPHNGPSFMNSTDSDYSVLYLVKNDRTNDTLYARIDPTRFVLVPYFIKQKELYEGKTFLYDDEKSWKKPLKAEDNRYLIKYEDDQGIERIKGKEVIVELRSRWICKEITLLKPTYKIHYILQNEKGEQIILTTAEVEREGFILADDYARREADKKLQKQQLLAKQKEDAAQKEAIKKRKQEKHKIEMVSLFGTKLGELIAQGKVQINMTKEMCKHSWGNPLRTNKITTEQGTTEHWYYNYGYSLHFINDYLKRIEE